MKPIAYFLTWTTYGTWLPGDARGWVHDKDGAWHVDIRGEEPDRRATAQALMRQTAVALSSPDRELVHRTIIESCTFKNWAVHALAVQTNHVHIVVTGDDVPPEKILSHLKIWTCRALNDRHGKRTWWTRHGSTRWLNDIRSLEAAIRYVGDQ